MDQEWYKSKIAKHVIGLPKSGIRAFFDIVSTRKNVISLAIGEPDFDTPWHIREAAIYSLERGRTHYTGNAGLLELRQAAADYVERFFKVKYDAASEVLITVGASEGIDGVLRALLNPGEEVLYHEPCFVSYAPTVNLAHGVPVSVPTYKADGFRLSREALEKAVTPRTKVLMLNFPNNPTGAVLRHEDLVELADFAISHDLIVISDEIYAEMTWGGASHESIAAIPGMRERTILVHGFSKSWAMTGFRMAYLCGPKGLLDPVLKIHQYAIMCAPTASQYAALEAFVQPEKDMAPMLRAYEQRRNFLEASFAEMGVPMHTPAGAFYAFPCIEKFGLTAHEFAVRLLDEHNVAVVPGTAFGACGEGFVRCSYATSMDNLVEAMKHFKAFVDSL